MGVTIGAIESRAGEAWRALHPENVEPARVDVLKGRKERKMVFRLVGAGPSGADVIAKRYRLSSGLVERAIYEDVLPTMAVPSLHCHGFLEEPDGTRCWIFLEDAGTGRYSASLGEHRWLAGRWLGLLHTCAADIRPGALPEHGASHYRDCLEQSRTAIEGSGGNPAIGATQRAVLRAVLRALDRLDERWREIERLCAAMPRALVHGDFVPKNLRVRESGAPDALLCFDWGCAGWGVPAVDLAQAPGWARRFAASPSLDAYWSTVRARWPECELASVRRWGAIGGIFRALVSLAWAGRSLASAWVVEPVTEMATALAILTRATGALGWGD